MGNKLHMNHKKTKKKKKKKLTKKQKKGIIDVPIDKNISLGSKASKGDIDYHYQKYYNTFGFIEEMISRNKQLQKRVCIPDIGDSWMKGLLSLQFLKGVHGSKALQSVKPVDSQNSKSKFISEIDRCMSHRLVPINLLIHVPDIGTHANIILMDTKKKTIELFEPHGSRREKSELENMSKAYYKVSKNISRFFKFYYDDYKFIAPTHYEPKEGLQGNIDAYSGLCVTWSILYLHYRILNPDVPQKRLLTYLDRRVTRNFILRYMKYIENILKGKI